ncbi:uncharacterized protein C18orf19 homolog A-like isoform X2 [Myripristis murdjan]|uniref:uncharacterized protein C18orf19 homolog A-like isoform X2 n=1 Tax=Myripristis murdjan TaxID=586833 RepID=UPI001175D378|nr:uncharacterized protein C18orf19 homolog A-like isoform X2 [Myripristis murdjan]
MWRCLSSAPWQRGGSVLLQAAAPPPTEVNRKLIRSNPLMACRRVMTSASVWSSGLRPPTDSRSAGPDPGAGPGRDMDLDPLQDGSLGLVSRFKRTLQQYGKVLIPVHLITSAAWFTCFYQAAANGMDVVPLLQNIPGFPEKILNLLENSHSGCTLTAYALYKISTPVRYTVSLGGTSLSIRYLRRHGYMSTPPPVSELMQEKMDKTKEKLSERFQETKDKVGLRRKRD